MKFFRELLTLWRARKELSALISVVVALANAEMDIRRIASLPASAANGEAFNEHRRRRDSLSVSLFYYGQRMSLRQFAAEHSKES